MPKITSKVQATITIPAPHYNFGQLVQWRRMYSNQSLYLFTGIIQCRSWEELEEEVGQWRYYVQIKKTECGGEPRFVTGGEDLPEAELFTPVEAL
jgi:hypothetical protein